MMKFLEKFAGLFFGKDVRCWGGEFAGLCGVFCFVFGVPGVTSEYAAVGAALAVTCFFAKFQAAVCQAVSHYRAGKRIRRKLATLCDEEKKVILRCLKHLGPHLRYLLTWPVQALVDSCVLNILWLSENTGKAWRDADLEFSAVMREILYDDGQRAELFRKVGMGE